MLVDPYKKSPGNQLKIIKRSRNNNPLQESSSDTEKSSADESIENDIDLLNETNDSKTLKKTTKKKKSIKKNVKQSDTRQLLTINSNFKLSLSEEQLMNDAWLSDTEINIFLNMLKEYNIKNNIYVEGLNDPIFLQSLRISNVDHRHDSFVEVLMSRDNHWVCLERGILERKDNGLEDISLYDSMHRSSIDTQLGSQCYLILPHKTLEKGKLVFRSRKIQKQNRSYCGYFALANAMAICMNIDPEKISFDEKAIKGHFIDIMFHGKTFSMFPYSSKTRINNTRSKYLEFSIERVSLLERNNK